jgi:hypothetical protein
MLVIAAPLHTTSATLRYGVVAGIPVVTDILKVVTPAGAVT